jgi:superfamily II DNA helicase RecQ
MSPEKTLLKRTPQVTPEKLMAGSFMELLTPLNRRGKLKRLVIDEASIIWL